MTRGWIEIDLDAIVRNAMVIAARAPAILPMVKADAYGVGALPVVRALERLSPWGYGVATIEEGRELRRAGITRSIVLFTPVVAGDLRPVRDARITPALSSAESIAAWTTLGGGPWHLAIDTGMSRAGARWDRVDALASMLRACAPEGAFTHFHSASLDDGTMAEQEGRFELALAALPARPAVLHAENSAAIARRSRSSWSLARPGIFLYGVGSGASAVVHPEPVVSLFARVVELRGVRAGESVSYDATYRAEDDRVIATLPIGYADGYRRALGNRAYALVAGGRRAPVVGVVTMDMTMIDVTGLQVAVGDVVTLLGNNGSERLDIETLAAQAGASPYELLTALHSRLPRRYRGGEG
ncbi:MAG TPA: alanine racemase [Gemmatimonadaceae bacterium]|nr:alanine racemase [Gemmatimonadaceae bacterium]